MWYYCDFIYFPKQYCHWKRRMLFCIWNYWTRNFIFWFLFWIQFCKCWWLWFNWFPKFITYIWKLYFFFFYLFFISFCFLILFFYDLINQLPSKIMLLQNMVMILTVPQLLYLLLLFKFHLCLVAIFPQSWLLSLIVIFNFMKHPSHNHFGLSCLLLLKILQQILIWLELFQPQLRNYQLLYHLVKFFLIYSFWWNIFFFSNVHVIKYR